MIIEWVSLVPEVPVDLGQPLPDCPYALKIVRKEDGFAHVHYSKIVDVTAARRIVAANGMALQALEAAREFWPQHPDVISYNMTVIPRSFA